jgi:hypothetical protein|tara:strand:+ start:538 stop:795 length:258 start_codon:yes stop_codon:yes gene_type:complete
MAENVKCLLVDLDNVLISEVEEVPSEIGDPDCKLIRPYRFYQDGKLEPWVKASNQTEYMIRSSDILTIADPTPELVQEYLKLTTE